jgi:hypothetical protein
MTPEQDDSFPGRQELWTPKPLSHDVSHILSNICNGETSGCTEIFSAVTFVSRPSRLQRAKPSYVYYFRLRLMPLVTKSRKGGPDRLILSISPSRIAVPTYAKVPESYAPWVFGSTNLSLFYADDILGGLTFSFLCWPRNTRCVWPGALSLEFYAFFGLDFQGTNFRIWGLLVPDRESIANLERGNFELFKLCLYMIM